MVRATPGGLFDPANPTTSEPISPNNEGGPASEPANGGPPGSDPANYLHSNPYPFTAAPGQPKNDCEAGREAYVAGTKQIGNTATNPGNTGAFPPKTSTSGSGK